MMDVQSIIAGIKSGDPTVLNFAKRMLADMSPEQKLQLAKTLTGLNLSTAAPPPTLARPAAPAPSATPPGGYRLPGRHHPTQISPAAPVRLPVPTPPSGVTATEPQQYAMARRAMGSNYGNRMFTADGGPGTSLQAIKDYQGFGPAMQPVPIPRSRPPVPNTPAAAAAAARVPQPSTIQPGGLLDAMKAKRIAEAQQRSAPGGLLDALKGQRSQPGGLLDAIANYHRQQNRIPEITVQPPMQGGIGGGLLNWLGGLF